MSNKKITKSSKDIKVARSKREDICPECKGETGILKNTVIDGEKTVRQYKCEVPFCGCEYEIEESHNGVVAIETGESAWAAGGMRQV